MFMLKSTHKNVVESLQNDLKHKEALNKLVEDTYEEMEIRYTNTIQDGNRYIKGLEEEVEKLKQALEQQVIENVELARANLDLVREKDALQDIIESQ